MALAEKWKTRKTKTKPNDIRVHLPVMHPKQLQVVNTPARFKVLNWGRRTGKSFLAKLECLDRAINRGEMVWWYSPSYNNANTHWREVKRLVQNAPFVVYKNEQQKIIEFASGGTIEFKTGEKYDNTRGSGIHFVVLDEAAYIPEQVWSEVVQPSLLDKEGSAMIISTPKGKQNWFYSLYLAGTSGDPEWFSLTCTTYENPYIKKDAIDKLKLTMTSHNFRQEIMAEFLDNAGGAFNGVELISTLGWGTPNKDRDYVAGIDWGRKNDYTVISVFDWESGDQVDLLRFTDIGYDAQINRIKVVMEKWEPKLTYVETNSMGGPLFERMEKELPYKFRPVYMTSPTKKELVEQFGAAIERKAVHLLKPGLNQHTTYQFYEMGSYELKRLANGNTITYSAPIGGHDDTVVAAILAWKGAKRRHMGRTFTEVENIFF